MARRSSTRTDAPAIPQRGFAIRAAILAIACALVYLNSLDAPFIFDDLTSIRENPQIRQLWPLSVPLSPPRDTPVAGRPVVNLTFALNYAAGRLDVTGYRAVNLVIHLLAALTLFALVRRTLTLPSLVRDFGQHATNLAWIVALVWALHPLQTETIDYVTQRTESMMGLCYLLTMYCSVRALDGHSRRWHAAAIGACAIGMACKESMVTAPIAVALYDRVFVEAAVLQRIRRVGLHAGLAATWIVLAALLATEPRTTAGFATNVSAWTYLLNQAPILMAYLRLTFWPRDLVLDYGLPQPLTIGDVVLPGLVVVALLGVAIWLLVRRTPAGFLAAWCFLTLAPTSSVVPIATEVGAERRMYLPLAGIAALVVLGVYRAWAGRDGTRPAYLAPALAMALCLALAAATVRRNAEYESLVSVLQTSVERRPHPRVHLMLGTALLDAGRREEGIRHVEMGRDDPASGFILGVMHVSESRFAAGAEELERFVQAMPSHIRIIEARESLGRAYSALGQLDRAKAHLTELLKLRPSRGPAHGFLGEVLLRQGRVEEGLREFQTAVDLQPGNPDALRLLGIAQGETGRLALAAETFKRAISIDPANARGYFLLGRALAASGQVSAAVPYFARAVELDPSNAEARADLQRAQEAVGAVRQPPR